VLVLDVEPQQFPGRLEDIAPLAQVLWRNAVKTSKGEGGETLRRPRESRWMALTIQHVIRLQQQSKQVELELLMRINQDMPFSTKKGTKCLYIYTLYIYTYARTHTYIYTLYLHYIFTLYIYIIYYILMLYIYIYRDNSMKMSLIDDITTVILQVSSSQNLEIPNDDGKRKLPSSVKDSTVSETIFLIIVGA
jgi:hypothetical protein